jgi:hypothetical protein
MKAMHPLHDILLHDLRADLKQMAEEGHDEAGLSAELERAAGSLQALADLQSDWWARPSPPAFPYDEPDGWDRIAATFPDPAAPARFRGTDGDLADRLLGAWQGRCAGCQLGKPLEGTMWPAKIRAVLETVGSWPLADYMNPAPPGLRPDQLPDCDFFQRNHEWRNTLCRGRFDHVAPDDDIHYALLSQMTLERHGVEFTSEQAIATIRDHLPISCLYGAGRNMYRTAIFGVPSPWTAVMGNPCRQSLGAMIRCDPFGWAAPGDPALAARMAWRDAVNSQTRNGIYAGIFFAALLADTLAHGDPLRAVDTAAAFVPPRSRFAGMIAWMKDRCARDGDWAAINDAMIERYRPEAQRFNHAIPNAAIVLLGLLKGGGDFTRTLGITVMAGLDTDCTGATAGSILGAALGARRIPPHWVEPFRDTMRTSIKGAPEPRITDVARRMFEIARRHARR